MILIEWLSPSSHKFGDEFISSRLSAALGHEPFGLELMAERLWPNEVSSIPETIRHNTSPCLRIEALREKGHLTEAED